MQTNCALDLFALYSPLAKGRWTNFLLIYRLFRALFFVFNTVLIAQKKNTNARENAST